MKSFMHRFLEEVLVSNLLSLLFQLLLFYSKETSWIWLSLPQVTGHYAEFMAVATAISINTFYEPFIPASSGGVFWLIISKPQQLPFLKLPSLL